MPVWSYVKKCLVRMRMKTNKVVIIRHGESEWNRLNLFCGWQDAPLSEKGIRDSMCIAAENLHESEMEFDQVYTSKLHRAHQTVEIILEKLNCINMPVIEDWRFNERHYGDLTGYNKRKMAEKYGEKQIQVWRRSYDIPPPPIQPDNPYYYSICKNPAFSEVPVDEFPFTESMKMVYERVVPAWNEIKAKVLRGERALIVVHGTVARSLVKHIEDISNEAIRKFNIPNSVPCVYEFDKETGKLIGGIKYLADEEYVKKEAAKVASLGHK